MLTSGLGQCRRERSGGKRIRREARGHRRAGQHRPRIAVPKKADRTACALATQQQVSAALGPVTGAAAPLSGNAGSCVWPLDTGAKNGFLVGYGVGYEK